MPIEVTGPDGTVAEFPDGTAPETIKSVMAKRFGTPQQQPADSGSGLNDFAHALTGGIIEGVPLVGPSMRHGLDYLGAHLRSLLGGGIPEEEYKHVRSESDRIAKERPITSGVGEFIGSVAGTAPLVAAAPAAFGAAPGMGLLARLTAGGASGGALGAGDAAVRGQDPLMGAALGGGGGALGAAVGPALSRGAARLGGQRAPVTPTAEDIANQSDQLYKAARAAGVTIRPQSFSNMVDNVEHSLGRVDPVLHPKTTRVLQIMRDRADEATQGGTGVGLDDIDALRQIVRDVAKTPDEMRMARSARQVLDDWADALPASDVVTGDKAALTEILPQARSLWRRSKKLELLEDTIDRAEDVAGGPTKVLTSYKARFRALKNHKDFDRTFSAEERVAINRVIRADGLEQFAQRLTSLTGMLGLGTAAAMSGATFGAATGGAGALGAATALGTLKYALGQSAARRAREAQHLVATGNRLVYPEALRSLGPSLGIGAGSYGAGLTGGGGGF